MRALIHGDDKSSWRSPAVQSLDNETDVMRFGRVFFRGQIFFRGSRTNIFHIFRPVFFGIWSAKNWDPLQSAELHCTVIVSIHHRVHFQLWDHQLKSGRVLKPRSEGRRISMMGLVGQAGATTMAGKGYGSERGQNLMEILRRGLCSLSTTWLRRKSADLQMAAYGKPKMVCT